MRRTFHCSTRSVEAGGRSRRGLRAALAAGALVAAALLSVPQTAEAAAPDQWTGTFGDSGNTSADLSEHTITASTASQVKRVWSSSSRSATPFAPMVLKGVAYRVTDTGNTNDPSTFIATAARTGKTLWKLTLPGGAFYFPGMTASGNRVVVAFTRVSKPGGLTAVDVARHRIVWRSYLAASTIEGTDSNPGLPYTDGTRVFTPGSSNDLNAFRLSSGARSWHVPVSSNGEGGYLGVEGIAVQNDVVYTSGQKGLVAYSTTSGKQLWRSTQPTTGLPVVAGTHVLVAAGDAVVEGFSATGCKHSTCTPAWTTAVGGEDVFLGVTVSGTDGRTAFLTYSTHSPTGGSSSVAGHVARISVSTGRTQWRITTGRDAVGLIRGGNTIWFYNEYSADRVVATRLLGYSTTATNSTPLARINLSIDDVGFPQTLAISAGTLLQQTWGVGTLIGYRIHE